jgi:predicted amidohydrolase YtcJ
MDLFEAGERLAQIHTSAGRPDDRYGACHLLTLDCGRFGRYDNGEPNGVLIEHGANDVVLNAKGMQDYPHEVAKIAATTDHFNERAIVAITDMMVFTRPYDHLRMYHDAEAEEEFFSRDDAHRVVGMLHKGSEALEWSPAPEGDPGAERYPGTGPYDTGAV